MSSLLCGLALAQQPVPQEPQLQDDVTSRGVFPVHSQVSNKKAKKDEYIVNVNTFYRSEKSSQKVTFCGSVYTVSRIGKSLETGDW